MLYRMGEALLRSDYSLKTPSGCFFTLAPTIRAVSLTSKIYKIHFEKRQRTESTSIFNLILLTTSPIEKEWLPDQDPE